MILFLTFFVVVLIPQLLESVMNFANNLDDYIKTISEWLKNWKLTSKIDLSQFINSSESMIDKAIKYDSSTFASSYRSSARVVSFNIRQLIRTLDNG